MRRGDGHSVTDIVKRKGQVKSDTTFWSPMRNIGEDKSDK